MLFNSLDFLLFLIPVVVFYFLLPQKIRNLYLLLWSYFFYGYWRWEYLALLLAVTSLDFWTGLQMGKYENKKQRKPYLILSLVINLAVLFTFKYFNFFYDSFLELIGISAESGNSMGLQLLLPIGISFYTFQTMSYSIEVYRGAQQAEKSFIRFALYVSFFPQLVAGPIERPQNLIPQFYQKKNFDFQLFTDGLKLILLGFFKKLVIADRLIEFILKAYQHPFFYTSYEVLGVTMVSIVAVYFDFGGYTDIARGIARMMGFELMENFRRPFFARSTSEFWNRWHISLTTWFYDYFYKTIIFDKRQSRLESYLGICILFTTIGLWHGASYNFMIWGLYIALFFIMGNLTKKFRNQFWVKTEKLCKKIHIHVPLKKIRQVYDIVFVIVFTNLVGPLFFCRELGQALTVYKRILMIDYPGFPNTNLFGNFYELGIAVVAIVFIFIISTIEEKNNRQFVDIMRTKPLALQWVVFYFIFLCIILFGMLNAKEFVYFQF